jgi:hypothetical protein
MAADSGYPMGSSTVTGQRPALVLAVPLIVHFFSKERLKSLGGIPKGHIEGSPHLVVQILSPGNTIEEMHKKVVDYCQNGSRLVGMIHPDEDYVLVYHQTQPKQLKRPGDCFEGEDVIPGFSLDLSDFFLNQILTNCINSPRMSSMGSSSFRKLNATKRW